MRRPAVIGVLCSLESRQRMLASETLAEGVGFKRMVRIFGFCTHIRGDSRPIARQLLDWLRRAEPDTKPATIGLSKINGLYLKAGRQKSAGPEKIALQRTKRARELAIPVFRWFRKSNDSWPF